MYEVVRIVALPFVATPGTTSSTFWPGSGFKAASAVAIVYDGNMLTFFSKREIRVMQMMRAASRWQKTLEANNIYSWRA